LVLPKAARLPLLVAAVGSVILGAHSRRPPTTGELIHEGEVRAGP